MPYISNNGEIEQNHALQDIAGPNIAVRYPATLDDLLLTLIPPSICLQISWKSS